MNIINKQRKKPLVLLILDGLGAADPNPGNAITLAKTPMLDYLWPRFPHTYLQASGNYVGLPTGVTGNSEVGHMSIGAGRVVFQEIAKIDHEIEVGSFYENAALLQAINHAKENNGKLHLMGVLSDGNVHASITHLYAILEMCKKEGLNGDSVYIHAFTDGRDTPPQNAKEYFAKVQGKMDALQVGKFATMIGRYFSMDRDNRWERTEKAYKLIVEGGGTYKKDWQSALDDAYSKNQTDEFIEPYVLLNDLNSPIVNAGDSIIFYNYRGDRAVQLSRAFVENRFEGFVKNKIENLLFVGFSNYEKGVVMNRTEQDVEDAGGESQFLKQSFLAETSNVTFGFPPIQAFPPARIDSSLGKIIADAGYSQLRLAESEKYPHVTYFFNCRVNDPYDREDRMEIPSPKDVATYDLKPAMSNRQIVAKFEEQLATKKYDFICVNFALTDMVAHTGNLAASINCVEVADEGVGIIVKKTIEAGGEVIITSDHGNVEELINMQSGEKDTQHSLNPVPFIHVSKNPTPKELQFGMLADIAPTILNQMGIAIPDGMTGRYLLE